MEQTAIQLNTAPDIKYTGNAAKYKVKNRWWLKYLIATAVLLIIAVLFSWIRGVFRETNRKVIFQKLSDAFFVTGFVAVFQILRAIIIKGGFLDKLAELWGKFVRLLRRDKVDRKYRNFANYRKALRDRQPSLWYLILLGILFMGLGAAFYLAYRVA